MSKNCRGRKKASETSEEISNKYTAIVWNIRHSLAVAKIYQIWRFQTKVIWTRWERSQSWNLWRNSTTAFIQPCRFYVRETKKFKVIWIILLWTECQQVIHCNRALHACTRRLINPTRMQLCEQKIKECCCNTVYSYKVLNSYLWVKTASECVKDTDVLTVPAKQTRSTDGVNNTVKAVAQHVVISILPPDTSTPAKFVSGRAH